MKKKKFFTAKINFLLPVINFLLLLYLFFLIKVHNKDAIELWIQAVAALGTLLAVFVAIFQDWIRHTLLPPQLKIELHNSEGVVVHSGEGNKTVFFHLKVVNYSKWSTAKNCEVLLVEVKTLLNNKNFGSVSIAVPRKFDWTPAYLNIAGITI